MGFAGLLMHGRPLRQTAGFIQQVAAIDPDLIEFEEPVNGLGIALPGQIQQPSSLIQFFFFGM